MGIRYIRFISGVTISQAELISLLNYELGLEHSNLLSALHNRRLLTNTSDSVTEAKALVAEVVEYCYDNYTEHKVISSNDRYAYRGFFDFLIKYLMNSLTTVDYQLAITTNAPQDYHSFHGWSIVIGKVIKTVHNVADWCDNEGYDSPALGKLPAVQTDKLLSLLETIFGANQAQIMMRTNYGCYQMIVRDNFVLY